MRSTTSAAGGNVRNHVDAFARDHRGGVEIAFIARLFVARRLVGLMLEQFGLAAAPAFEEFVAQRADAVGRRPHVAPHDVEHDAADRLVAACRDDALLGGMWTAASSVA